MKNDLLQFIKITDVEKYSSKSTSVCCILILRNKIILCEKYNSFVFFKLSWLISSFILFKKKIIDPLKYIDALLLKEKLIINRILKNKELLRIFNSMITRNNAKSYIDLEELVYIFTNKLKMNKTRNSVNYFLISYFIFMNNIKLNINKSSNKLFVFPGGHIKENESIINTLKREVKEETNITLENQSYDEVYYVEIYDRLVKKVYSNIIFYLEINNKFKFKSNEEIKRVKMYNFISIKDSIEKVFDVTF